MAEPAEQVTICNADDMHLHLRDGAMLSAVLPFSAKQFSRALIMPNLKPPVRTLRDAEAYRDRIKAALPKGSKFTPYMTLYLTDSTTPKQILEAKESGFVLACKLYPAGATTNSAAGVTSIENIHETLAEMERVGMVLAIHGEVTEGARYHM